MLSLTGRTMKTFLRLVPTPGKLTAHQQAVAGTCLGHTMTMCLRLAAAAVAAGTVPLLPHTVATTGPAEGGSTSAARVGGTNGPTQEQSKATAHEQMMRGGAAWGRLVAAMAVTETGWAAMGVRTGTAAVEGGDLGVHIRQAGSGTGSGTGTETGSKTGTETGTGTGSETGSETAEEDMQAVWKAAAAAAARAAGGSTQTARGTHVTAWVAAVAAAPRWVPRLLLCPLRMGQAGSVSTSKVAGGMKGAQMGGSTQAGSPRSCPPHLHLPRQRMQQSWCAR
mmetsp:Transcript_26071/g.70580  ORF Transcript_26071/g.70580 Transcript_26071/m.70580 type:complete len:280 (+) Transcript_26071:433-1272(+)